MSRTILPENVIPIYEEVVKQLFFQRDTAQPLWHIVLKVVCTAASSSYTNYVFVWRDEANVVRARAILRNQSGQTLYGVKPKCPNCPHDLKVHQRGNTLARTLKCPHCHLDAKVAGPPAWLHKAYGGSWYWADYPYPSSYPTLLDMSVRSSS